MLPVSLAADPGHPGHLSELGAAEVWPQDDDSVAPGTVRPRVQISDLETYYLPDKDGQLIPVFQFPFEEFERLLQQDRTRKTQTTANPVGFRVVSAQFSSAVTQLDVPVELRIKLRINLLNNGWKSIPLGLTGWVLSGRIQSPSSVQHYLTRAENGSLVLHVNGPLNEVLEFDIPVSRRVQKVGHLFQLPVAFPYPTQTNFRLTLPETGLSVRGGDMVDVSTVESDGQTIVTARELSEKSVIAWQPMAVTSPLFPLKARVESNTRVQTLGLGRWQVTSLLDLTPLGEPLSNCILVLPVTASDVTSPQSNIRVERLTRAEAQQAASQVPDQQQYFRLSLINPTSDPTQIQLSYLLEIDAPAGQSEAEVEFRGPVLLDCTFGSGRLDLVKDRELSNTWQLGGGISLSTSPPLNRDELSFVVERQDFRLMLMNRPQPAQVRVETEYTLTMIANQRFYMTVNYRCQIQGKFTEKLWVDLHDWEFVSGGVGVQLQDRRMIFDPSLVTIGTGGELSFLCILEGEAAEQVQLKLPRLQGEAALVQQPARIILVLDDPSREFRFDAENSNVIRESAAQERYRSKDANSDVVLSGQFGLRPQRVELRQWLEIVDATPQLGLRSNTDQTPQRLAARYAVQMDVEHQPLPGLGFLLESTAPLSQLQVSLGNEILPLKSTTVSVAGRNFYALEFPLGADRLGGKLNFMVSGILESPPTSSDASSAPLLQIPLIQVVTEPMSRLASLRDEAELHDFLRRQIEGFQIQTREIRTPVSGSQLFELGSEWVRRSNLVARTTDLWETWVMPDRWPTHVSLLVRSAPTPPLETVVRQVHLRTWWSGDKRREQYVARIQSPAQSLQVAVQPEMDLRRVLVNGTSVPFELKANREQVNFALDLPRESAGRSLESVLDLTNETAVNEGLAAKDYEIELWYDRNQPAAWLTTASLQIPQLPNQAWCRDFRWEFSLNDRWRLLWLSADLSREQEPGSLFGSEQNDAAQSAAKTFHFSSSYEPSSQGVILVSRPAIRLVGIIAIAGLVLLSWFAEWYRRPTFWLSIAVVIALVSWGWPELGWDLTPWVAPSLLASLAVLWWEYASLRPPLGDSEPPHDDHTTQTYWREASSVSERSAGNPSIRKSDSVGDPVA